MSPRWLRCLPAGPDHRSLGVSLAFQHGPLWATLVGAWGPEERAVPAQMVPAWAPRARKIRPDRAEVANRVEQVASEASLLQSQVNRCSQEKECGPYPPCPTEVPLFVSREVQGSGSEARLLASNRRMSSQ